jgi:hypothetical protein
MPHLLEFFSGTGSIGRAFAAQGWQVTSVDIRADFRPTILCDVMAFDVKMLEGLPPVDLLWASPPCTHYSSARTTAKTPRDLVGSDAMVQKVLDIADQLFCHYLMENPFSGLLKTRDVISQCPHMRVLDYCKYGSPYRKRTAIWTNSRWEPSRPMCKYDCEASAGRRHTSSAQRGGQLGREDRRYSLEELYAIPPALCEELARWPWV